MDLGHLNVILSRASTMPVLPTVVTQVMELADNPNAGTRDFERVIARDTVLSAKILRTANSSYYGGDGNISSLQRALAKLGCNVVRSICITVAFQSSMNRKDIGDLNIVQLWQHSLAVACASKVLAILQKDAHAEEAFVAGLLHDVGKLALAIYMPKEHQAVSVLMHTKGISQYEAEMMALQVTHQEIGKMVAEHWGLPAMYHPSISQHHTPFSSSEKITPLLAYVHVGNALAHQTGLGYSPNGCTYEPDMRVVEQLGIAPEQFEPLRQAVAAGVARLSTNMGLVA